MTTPGPAPDIPDLVEVAVPAGARVLVASDLHLTARPSQAERDAVDEVVGAIKAWDGPGAVVLAGDILELLAGGDPDPAEILADHHRLVTALRTFAGGPERSVVYLIGNHDNRLGWDAEAAHLVAESMQAQLAFAAELVLETAAGPRRVRVEHGNNFDPANTFTDPRNPLDAPLGHHIVREVLPALHMADRPWLAGMETLDDPVAFPSFVASRLAYRRLTKHVKWLALPLLVALALKLPLTVVLLSQPKVSTWEHRLAVLGIALVADLVLVVAAVLAAARQAWEAVAVTTAQRRGRGQNEGPRAEARRLIGAGLAGLVTGHTHHPELTPMLDGFYANTGCAMSVVDERPSHAGFPPVFLASRTMSWLELEAAADVHARLVYGRTELPGASRLERLAARRPTTPDGPPAVVATFPDGVSWPAIENEAARLRRTRTRAAVGIAVVGLVDLASALTPPFAGRLHTLRAALPFGVPRAAAALAALAGIALLLLARGVSRGGRRAWAVALGLLLGSAVLHVLKGVDVEEAGIALAASAYLWARRQAFRAPPAERAVGTTLRVLGSVAAVATAIGTVAIEVFSGGEPRLPLARAAAAAAERLVWVTTIALPDRLDDFLTPVLAAVGFGTILVAGWLVFRPAVPRRHTDIADRARARDVVERYGGDSLAYFALRDDKQVYFWADSMVAYAVMGEVCLVSPDPIGPVAERSATWAAFHQFAAERGWTVTVMGASEEWLPIYRAAGMRDLYVGDEAIVDCTRFNLEGGKAKGLRQAVNRIARYGYRVEFFDPAHLQPELRASLQKLMSESRRGDVERGFSMTLSRIFDPADRHLLLTVCFGPEGEPAAFCQWVPATGINGYSLDLMRRSKAEHPNGLLDFVVVETIRHLAGRGMRGLALNFATMRAVLAGEMGSGPTQRVERWLLNRMSDTMQIDSLWKYNAKFNPEWKPRYAVYESPQDILAGALAVAKAESFWELPIVGRFMVPDRPPPSEEVPA